MQKCFLSAIMCKAIRVVVVLSWYCQFIFTKSPIPVSVLFA